MKFLYHSLYTFLGIVLISIPYVAFAQTQVTYTPMVGLPNLGSGSGRTLPEYINAIYLACISIGAVIGVLRIAFAGVKYSLSDIVTNKESAKSDIKGVLLGLLILLTPALILREINPNLLNLDVLAGRNRMNLNSYDRSINTGNLSPNERTQVLNSCKDGELVSTGVGKVCCKTPQNDCNVKPTTNSMGVDTAKIYTPDEVRDIVNAFKQKPNKIENFGSVGAGNTVPEITCNAWGRDFEKGAEAIVFTQNETVDSRLKESRILVCVQKL